VARPPRDLNTSVAIAPHKTFLLIVSLVGGLIGMIYPQAIATSIAASIPAPFQVSWFGGLAVTSALALYGVYLASVAGLLWERVALLVQAVLLLAYLVAVVGFNGAHGVGAGLFYVGYAAANLYRAWIITHTLKLYPPPGQTPSTAEPGSAGPEPAGPGDG
jgi:uncharacterized membrane protein